MLSHMGDLSSFFLVLVLQNQTQLYRQTWNIIPTLVGNKLADHSDVVGASPVGAAPTTSSFSPLTPGFNILHKDNCKTKRETFKFWDLVQLLLDIWRFSWVESLHWRRLQHELCLRLCCVLLCICYIIIPCCIHGNHLPISFRTDSQALSQSHQHPGARRWKNLGGYG